MLLLLLQLLLLHHEGKRGETRVEQDAAACMHVATHLARHEGARPHMQGALMMHARGRRDARS